MQRETGHDVDLFLGAAMRDHQFGRAAHFRAETHAARAHHAAVDEQIDVAQVALATGEGHDVGPPAGLTVLEMVVLQNTLARLVADRAIDRVPQEQVFFDHRPGLAHLVIRRDDHQAIRGRNGTAGHELGLHLDLARLGVAVARLDQAHAATAHDRQAGVVAVMRDLDAGPFGGLDGVHALAVRQFDFASVDGDFGHHKQIPNSKSEITNKFQIPNSKSKNADHSECRRIAFRININSVLSWTRQPRSASSAASSFVSNRRNQYRVSLASFLEMRMCMRKSFLPSPSLASM